MDEAIVRQKLKEFITRDLIRDETYVLADTEGVITEGLMDSFSLAELAVAQARLLEYGLHGLANLGLLPGAVATRAVREDPIPGLDLPPSRRFELQLIDSERLDCHRR